MNCTRRMEIVEALKAAANEDFGGIKGNPWEPNPPQLRHLEMMMFVRVDVPLAAEKRLRWRLTDDEKSFLSERAWCLVSSSEYYRELIGEVDGYQRQQNPPATERVARLKRRGAKR